MNSSSFKETLLELFIVSLELFMDIEFGAYFLSLEIRSFFSPLELLSSLNYLYFSSPKVFFKFLIIVNFEKLNFLDKETTLSPLIKLLEICSFCETVSLLAKILKKHCLYSIKV